MKPTSSKKLTGLPPYLFVRQAALKQQSAASGHGIIDLGQGSPDLPSPANVVAALKKAIDEPWTHRYPQAQGQPQLRAAIADWYKRRFNVTLDPETEVLPLIGSKEGIVKLFLAYLDPGDSVLLTTPCYPAYLGATSLTQAKLVNVPLTPDHRFHPVLSEIPDPVADAAKFLTVNYPHNPTGGTETPALYEEVVAFARRHELMVVSDIAYCDLSLDPSYRAHSLLEFDPDKKNVIEFHSFSKTFSMQGWRIGFCAGNKELIANLARIKSNMDFSIFMAVQKAAIAALDGPMTYTQEMAALYRRRRDVFLEGVSHLGYKIEPPQGGMYVWLPIPPDAKDSISFTTDLLAKTGVLVAPGIGFGPSGEGYVRVALCEEEDRLREACDRLAKAGVRVESLV